MYNYRTRETDTLEGNLFDLPDEQIVDYLPQFRGKGLYECLRQLGKSKAEAFMHVLNKVTVLTSNQFTDCKR